MSLTGEINQHLQGNRARVPRQFSLLKLIGNVAATSNITGTLQVVGGVGITGALYTNSNTLDNGAGLATISGLLTANNGISVTGGSSICFSGSATLNMGTGSYSGIITLGNNSATLQVGSTIASPTGTGLSIIPASGQALNLGSNTNTTNINISNGIVNIATGSSSSAVNIGTGSYTGTITIGNSSLATNISLITTTEVLTKNNTLDDGNGNVVINGNSNSPLIVNQIAGGSGNCDIQLQNSGSIVGYFAYNSSGGMTIFNGAGTPILQQASSSTSDASLHSKNNILDDGGSGIATFTSAYSKNYLVCNATQGLYWNDGTGSGGTNYFSITSSNTGGLTFTDRGGVNFNPLVFAPTTGHATFSGLITGNAGLTIVGTTNINNTGSASTNINTVGGTLTIGGANSFVGNGGNVLLLNTANPGGNFSVLSGVAGTNSMTFGSDTGPTTFNTHGTININTSGSSSINIGTGSFNGRILIGQASSIYATQFLNGVIGPNNVFDTVSGGGSSWVGKMNVQSSAHNSTVTTGAMTFTGSSLSIGLSSFSIGGNATELNFGQSYAQRMLCLYDGGTLGNDDQYQFYGLGVTPATLYYSVDSGGFHRFYTGTSSSASTKIFEISHTKAVITANNTLDDSTGAASFIGTLTVTKGSATPGIDIQSTVSGDGGYLRVQNTNSTNQVYFGIDGTGLTGIQAGAAIIATDSTHSLPIYITPGNGANWALKAVTVGSQGYVTCGRTPWFQTTVTTPSTGNQTISAAQILGGIVLSPVQSSAYQWTTDSGTNLYSAMGSPGTNTTVTCLWSNDNNAAGAVMTIAFGSGVTGNLRGNTLANNQSMVLYFRCTGTNTFTVYS